MKNLVAILLAMRAEATLYPDRKYVRTLRNGLTLRLEQISETGLYILDAERDQVFPSDVEMQVLRRDFGLPVIGHGQLATGATFARWLAFTPAQPVAPRPWRIDEWAEEPTAWNSVRDATGKPVCIQFGKGTRGSAEYAMRAVNQYDDLIAALDDAIAALDGTPQGRRLKLLREACK